MKSSVLYAFILITDHSLAAQTPWAAERYNLEINPIGFRCHNSLRGCDHRGGVKLVIPRCEFSLPLPPV